MKKITTKVKVDRLTEVTGPLTDSGRRLSKPFEEFDRIFVPNNYQKTYKTATRAPKLIIRTITRSNQQNHLLILKRLMAKKTTLFFQTPILNYDQMAHIINQIGYEFYGEVKKERRQLVVGSITMNLDQIDDDGYYFKVEKIVGPNEMANIQELDDIIASLGIANRQRTKEYIEILKEKHNAEK